ncbi:MAG: bifunctional nuclease family protein [Candidatus Omnitrophica bacterium]|nr:bifunctional nuclease family protein [Candidatus Omnitrophota bacterium]MBU4589929.1 bifunctional nuclease family protein [Candidatus Omnitrophota bacterium]
MAMIEMELNKIRIDENRGEQVIVLKEKDGNRVMPIVIGIMEVTAIKMRISGLTPPRPMTHDLFCNTISQIGAKIDRIVITKLEQNTFFAKLVVQIDSKLAEVDARPSDSIALAIRAKAPIFVEEELLNKISNNLE